MYSKIGFFDEQYKMAADFDWICKALYNNYKIKWIDDIITDFRVGGVSSTFRFMLESYSVSNKYMSLTNDPFIEDMKKNTVDLALGFFLKEMCEDVRYKCFFEDFFKSIGLSSGDIVQIWGAGVWPKYYINAFSECNIIVNYIFDSNTTIKNIYGIEVMPFDKNRVTKLFISTENYDYEVSDILRMNGFTKDVDYFEFHSFRDRLLQHYDRHSENYKEFVETTGLTI